MRLREGLIDYSSVPRKTVLLFTGNSFVTKQGKLVMGRGAAKQVRDLYPGIDKEFGSRIKSIEDKYGVILLPDRNIGVFQVKYSWMQNADLELIKNSTKTLKYMALYSAEYEIHLNYPGIGNGKLKEEDVYPLIKDLPDNVVVYK